MTLRDRQSARERVTVDLEYMVFLHDFLRLNLTEMKKVLGESSSSAIYDYSADYVLKALGQSGRSPADMDKMVELFRRWGFRPKTKDEGLSVKVEWECPIAAAVHPNLAPSDAGCPLGELALGIVRQSHPMAQLESNELTGSGAIVSIRKGEDAPRR
jgi:hypothetical protein